MSAPAGGPPGACAHAAAAADSAPRYRWVILAVGVLASCGLSALQLGLPALAPPLRERFGLSLVEVGLLFTAVGLGIMVTQIPWGALADRIGERAVMAVGLGGQAAAIAVAATADTWPALVAALVVAGASGSAAAGGSGRAVMGWFGRTERATALGIRQMAIPLGGAIAALMLPLLAIAGGIGTALLGLSALSAAGALAAALLVREAPPAPANRPAVQAPPPLRDARVWRLGIGAGLFVCAQVALLSFLVLYLVDVHGMAYTTAAALLAGIQIAGAVTRVVTGRRSDRSGRRIAPLRRIGAAATAGVAACGALAAAPLVVALPVLLVATLLSMSWNGLAFTAAAEMAGRARAGTAIGLQGTVMRGLSATSGVGFGALVSATSYGVAFAVLALLPLAGWRILAPLEPEEEGRIAARERRLARDRQTALVPTPVGGTQAP